MLGQDVEDMGMEVSQLGTEPQWGVGAKSHNLDY